VTWEEPPRSGFRVSFGLVKEIATEGPSPGRASFREWVAGRCAAQRPAENRRAPNDPQARVACCRGGRVVRPGDRPWVGSGARGLRHAVGHADTPGDQPHAALDGARMGPGVRPVAGSVAAGLCQSAPLPGALVEHRGSSGSSAIASTQAQLRAPELTGGAAPMRHELHSCSSLLHAPSLLGALRLESCRGFGMP